MWNVGDAYVNLDVDMRPLSRAFDQGERDARRFASTVEQQAAQSERGIGKLSSAVGGIFAGIGMGVAQAGFGLIQNAVGGLSGAIFGLNNEAEAATAKINAFTKDSAQTAKILDMVRDRAAKTPFAFSEMANAAGALIPVGKQAKISLEDLMKQAEILAASNPMQGLEGASFSLREAMTGDFGSIIERFNLSRSSINKWKEEGLSNFEIVQKAMAEMGFDSQLVANMGETMSGRWSTFLDTLDQFKIKATGGIFNGLKDGLVVVQGFLDSNTESISHYAEVIGTKLGQGVSWAVNHLDDLGRAIIGAKNMIGSIVTAVETTINAFRTGNFNSAFGPILNMIDEVFGEKARNKAVMFVSGALSGLQTLRDSVLTFGQAFSGNWQDSDKIASPFVRAVGNIGQNFFNIKETAKQAWSGDWVDSDTIANPVVRGVGIITKTFSDTFDSLKGIIAPKWEAVSKLWESGGAGAVGTGIITRILGDDKGGELIQKVGEIGDRLQPIFDAVQNFNYSGFFKEIGDDLGIVWKNIEPTVKGFLDFYQSIAPMGAVMSPITGHFNIWADLAGKLGPIIGNTLGAAFVGVRGALEPLGGLFQQIGGVIQQQMPMFQQIGDQLMELWTALTPVITFAAGVIGTVLVTALGMAISSFGGLVGFIGGALPGALQIVSGALDVVIGIVNTVVSVVGGLIGIVVNLVQGDWRGAWDAAKGMVSGAADGIGQIIGGLNKMVVGFITGMIDGVIGAVKGFAATFVGFFQGIYDAIVGHSIIPDLVSGVKGFISGMVTDVVGFIGDMKDRVIGFFADLYNGAKQKVIDLKNDATTEITTLKDNIVNKAGEIVSNVIDKFTQNVATIKGLLMKPYEEARDAIGGVVSGFVSNMKGALNTGIRAWNSLGSGVIGVFNFIVKAVGQDDKQRTYQPVPELAKGTSNWGGGWAWVGDGNGGSGAELAYLPQGAKVIPHAQSMAMVANGAIPMHNGGKNAPSGGGYNVSDTLPEFAFGLDIPNPFDIFKNGPKWLLEQAMKAAGLSGLALPGIFSDVGSGVFGMVKDWLTTMVANFVKNAFPVNPDQIQKGLDFALRQEGLPYIWGGGHGPGLGGDGIGFDCSGFVASVLDAMGIANPHGIVTAFYEWMEKGRTGIVDIGIANPYAAPDVQHTGIGLMGRWFEAGGIRGNVGPTQDYFPEIGHPPGMGGSSNSARGAGGLRGIDVGRSLDNMRRAGAVGQWSGGMRAFANGGLIDEPVTGIGMHTGIQYLIGEAGKEIVFTPQQMDWLYQYFFLALTSGRTSNEVLSKFPLEVRPLLQRLAGQYIAAYRAAPNTRGLTNNPAGMPNTRGLNPGPGWLPPNTTGLNNGKEPSWSEFLPNGKPITYMPADPVVAPITTPNKDGGSASSSGTYTIIVRVDEKLSIGGMDIARSVTGEAPAIKLVADGVTEVQATEIEKKKAGPTGMKL